MIFKWLVSKATDVQQGEASRLLTSLRGADNELIDLVSAQTMYWANFYRKQGLDLYNMADWILSDTMFPVKVVAIIKDLQKQGSPTSTVGLQIWLHSARALITPELRLVGRELWAELVKAGPEAEVLAHEMSMAGNIPPWFDDRTAVPVGLEPISR